MTKINYLNGGVGQLVVPQGELPKEILLKTDAKDKLVRAQMAANPYNLILGSKKPVVEASVVTEATMSAPIINSAPVNESEQPAVNPEFSAPIPPADLLGKNEEPVIPSMEPVNVEPVYEAKPTLEEQINPMEALQRVQEALNVSLKIVDECLNELNKSEEQGMKKVA